MVFGASIILRRDASLPSQPFPGPFSNSPYGHPPLSLRSRAPFALRKGRTPFVLRTFPPRAGETRPPRGLASLPAPTLGFPLSRE